jgi:tetratricopeptide (TPR) repeat protein
VFQQQLLHRRSLLIFVIVFLCGAILGAQTTRKQQTTKKPADNETKLLQYRFRLENNPHDEEAHKGLIELLRAKNAFRAELEEDGTWLKNNPADWMAEIEMSSLADAATDDPEYRFAIVRYILSHTKRDDDDRSYDFAESRLAFALLKRKHVQEALDLLRKEASEVPNDAGVWENLADALARSNRAGDSLEAYKKSIALDTTQYGPHEGLAKAYRALKRYTDSETEYKAAISIYNAEYHTGEPTDSFQLMIKKMQEATHEERSLSKLYCGLAKVYEDEKNYSAAIAELDNAERATSDDKISYEYETAHIYEESGQLDKANNLRAQAGKEVRSEMSKEPKNPEMDEYLAYPEVLMFTADDDADSDDVLYSAQQTIAFYASLPPASLRAMDMLTLGMAYCSVGKAVQCRSDVESAFRLGGKIDRAQAHHNLAEGLSAIHDSQGALEHFQRAYELDPMNVTYRMDFEIAKEQSTLIQSH